MPLHEDHALETYKSLISLGSESLKALQLLNGGAIVALLAYLGQANMSELAARSVSVPLILFVAGLSLGTLCFLTSYLTQLALFNESVRPNESSGKSHTFWLRVTVGVAGLSLVAFVAGAFCGVKALTGV